MDFPLFIRNLNINNMANNEELFKQIIAHAKEYG